MAKAPEQPRRTYPDPSPKDGADPKPLEEFHYFSKLPPELRITIWEMALRPRHVRGVHYFSLFKSAGDRASPLLDLAIANRRLREYEKKEKPFLLGIEHRASAPRVAAPPACDDDNHDHDHDRASPSPSLSPSEYSWFKGNRSLYAWDAGLVSACRESRRILMESIYPLPLDEWVIEGRHNGETLHLRDHGQDLFCFEFEREDIEASMSIRWGDLLPQLSLRLFALCPGDIAFEFHPSWIACLPDEGEPFDLHREPSARGLVARVFEAWCHREVPSYIRLWLIDREIRPKVETRELHRRPWKFSDLRHQYVGIESRDVFYGYGKRKRERNSVIYLCQRLNRWKRSIPGAPRRSCLGVLAYMPAD